MPEIYFSLKRNLDNLFEKCVFSSRKADETMEINEKKFNKIFEKRKENFSEE